MQVFTDRFRRIAVFYELIIEEPAEHDVRMDNVRLVFIEVDDVYGRVQIASALLEKRIAQR